MAGKHFTVAINHVQEMYIFHVFSQRVSFMDAACKLCAEHPNYQICNVDYLWMCGDE